MKFAIAKGSTSVILPVFIKDSSQTDGRGLGSLDQTSSIVGGYLKKDSTGVALAVDENVTTEGTYEAPSVVGKVRIGTPANMRTGTYELHFHNDLFTTKDWVTITLGGASNMAPLNIEIRLIALASIVPAGYVGDYKLEEIVYFIWQTKVAPSVAGTIKIYRDDVTGAITTGITDDRNFAGLSNVNLCTVDLSADAAFSIKRDFAVVVDDITLDGQTADILIASFSVQNRYPGIDFKRDV